MANLEMTRDRTRLFQITVTQAGAALPLTGMSLAFAAKEKLSDSTPLIAKSSPSNGITITSVSGGRAVLQIDPTDTDPLTDIGSHTLVWDLKLTSGAQEYGIASGKLKVLGNVGD